MRILLVSDKPTRARALQRALRGGEFGIDIVPDAGQGLLRSKDQVYDVVVLDFSVRASATQSLLTKLRRSISTPILVLDVSPKNRVRFLRSGADDCLTRPFSTQELVARIEALSRRSSHLLESLTVGDLQLDRLRRRAIFRGQPVELSIKEYELLECLMQHAGQIVTREMVLRRWDLSPEILSNVVDVYVSYLRAKLDSRFGTVIIRTVRRRGYMLRNPARE